MFNLIRPLVFKLSPENAHTLAIQALKINYLPQVEIKGISILETKFFNKTVKSPIGVAAGFDKNAEVINKVRFLNFGFTEVGTITPMPQYGNPKPRIFRLEKDEAIINRNGFNNLGMLEAKKKLENYSKLRIKSYTAIRTKGYT